MGLKASRCRSPVTAKMKTKKDISCAMYSFMALLRLVLSIQSPPTSLMKRIGECRYLNTFLIFQMAMANRIICTDQTGMVIRFALTLKVRGWPAAGEASCWPVPLDRNVRVRSWLKHVLHATHIFASLFIRPTTDFALLSAWRNSGTTAHACNWL
jgi:hypothetical protein